MGTTVVVNNKVLTFLNGLVAAFMDGGEAAADAYITAADPEILAIPFVAWLISEGLAYLGGMLDTVVEKTTDVIVIDIQVNGEESAVMQTGTALQLASAGGNTNDIATAKAQASAALVSLIKLDGWGVVVKLPGHTSKG